MFQQIFRFLEVIVDDDAIEFVNELNDVVKRYQFRISNDRAIGMIHMLADEISQRTRGELMGPHELS